MDLVRSPVDVRDRPFPPSLPHLAEPFKAGDPHPLVRALLAHDIPTCLAHTTNHSPQCQASQDSHSASNHHSHPS